MNFTSRCDQGISSLVEQHQGGNCGASIVKFLKSRKLRARVHLHVCTRAYLPRAQSKRERGREREKERRKEGESSVKHGGDRYPAKAVKT